ncbi:hypothetical protein KC19_VG263600 [Ceratodon purpureus]|uniref:Response regulatory domain-containing protein n=1 Tax=Ceratodon purpureus TaxID=3225 RepID=A0A8T0HVH2_CERPU|nr:hypothetical protein KC19_VG263600 [Ceratodon purpureus]
MRRAPTTLAHPGTVLMPGVVVMPLTAPDRLRLYRRCFHELEEQMMVFQVEGRQAEVRSLQVELRFLEELIMVFTELNTVPAKTQLPTPEVWMADAAVEGLDLSLVTDILMLSATSPWTVYIADRNQWLLCYVSPSGKRTTGWTSQELLGTPAWGACHSDDVPVLQRMLHLRDSETSGGSVIYRRLKKDRSYVTVQATGRIVGTRWFAWVEQDILNFSPVNHQEELSSTNHVNANSKGSRVVTEGESPVVIRPRRQSAPWVGPPEVPYPNWDHMVGSSRPISPAAVVTVGLLQQSKGNTRHGSLGLDFDEAYISELSQMNSRSQKAASMLTNLNTETEQNGASPVPIKPSDNEGTERASKVSKGKLVAQDTSKYPSNTSSNQGLHSVQLDIGKELLQGKKVLLAEDDAVNRKVGQRLLRGINCDVTVVCNGQEALDVLRQVPAEQELATGEKELPPQFDLVLMDLQMPVMDGTHAVIVCSLSMVFYSSVCILHTSGIGKAFDHEMSSMSYRSTPDQPGHLATENIRPEFLPSNFEDINSRYYEVAGVAGGRVPRHPANLAKLGWLVRCEEGWAEILNHGGGLRS